MVQYWWPSTHVLVGNLNYLIALHIGSLYLCITDCNHAIHKWYNIDGLMLLWNSIPRCPFCRLLSTCDMQFQEHFLFSVWWHQMAHALKWMTLSPSKGCAVTGNGQMIAVSELVKVGIGPGSVCTTRIQARVGIPQFSAILECAKVAHQRGAHITSDKQDKQQKSARLCIRDNRDNRTNNIL